MEKAIKTGYFYVLVDFVVISGVLEVHFFGRKTSQKKRKTFDMTKARVKGTEAAAFVKSQAQLKVQESKVYKHSCQPSPQDGSHCLSFVFYETRKEMALGIGYVYKLTLKSSFV